MARRQRSLYRFDEGTRAELLELQWWKYTYADFPKIDPTDINLCITAIEAGVQSGEIAEFKPDNIKVSRR